MTKLTAAVAGAVLAVCTGCVKDLSNSDERLDRDSPRSRSLPILSAEEVGKLKCDDLTSGLLSARDDSRTEEQRLAAYIELYAKATDRTTKYEQALNRNPDLAYQEGSEAIVAAREQCIHTEAEVRMDLESLVREVVQLPAVDEIRGGSTVKVARLNFATLREAIDVLKLEDRDLLVGRIVAAEQQILSAKPPGKRGR